MNKNILLLLLGFILSFCFFLNLNNTAEMVSTECYLSSEVLDNTAFIRFEHSKSDSIIHLSYELDNAQDELGLMLENISSFTLSANGEILYTCREDDAGQAMYIVHIPSPTSGTLELEIRTPYIRRQTMLAIGSLSKLENLREIRQLNEVVFMSLQLFAVFISFILFISKRSERYLLGLIALLISTFLLRLVNNAATAHVFSNRVSKFLLPTLGLLPFFLEILLFYMLLSQKRTAIGKKSFFLFVAAAMAVCCLVGLLFPDVYTQLSLSLNALILFTAIVLLHLNSDASTSGFFLSLCFGIDLGTLSANQYIYLFKPVHSLGYLNLTTISAMSLAGGVLVYVLLRYSHKFAEAEQLADELKVINSELDIRAERKAQELVQERADRHGMMLNIFHDLRSPLYVSNECLKDLQNHDGDEEEHLTILAERLGFMNRLVEDLFLTAKMESDDFLLVTDPVPFSELFDSQCAAMAIAFREKGVSFSYHSEKDLVVWGDSYRLEQVVQNLLQNALVYTPPGKKVKASLKRIGDEAAFTISDTGKGIAEKDIPNIFTRYYRVNRAQNPKSTGLGLSIANEIIKAHRGTLSVNSTLGIGTSFTGCLPLLLPDTDQ